MRHAGIVATALLGAGLLTLVGGRWLGQRLTAAATSPPPGALDEVIRVPIGGLEQTVLVRGRDPEAPVLLWLHGGPGRPFLPIARRHPPRLEDDWILVYWAQRGTPGSNGDGYDPDDLTVDRLVADTHAMIDWARGHFGRERITMVGDSWGSALGALAASRRSDGLEAYVGFANSVCRCVSDEYNLDYAWNQARRDGNQQALAELRPVRYRAETGGPEALDTADLVTIAQWIRHYGGYSQSEPYDHGAASARLLPHGVIEILLEPGYSLASLVRFLRDPFVPFRRLFDGLLEVDLRRDAAQIEVPVTLIHGRHDAATPLFAVEDYYELLDAPAGKELVVFEASGHEILTDEPERLAATLRRVGGAR